MSRIIEVRLPDVGDVDEVDVGDVLVAAGDSVEAEEGLITLESDKASMDLPAPQAGVVKEVLVKIGDQVSEGALVATLEVADEAEASETNDDDEPEAAASEATAADPPPEPLPAAVSVSASPEPAADADFEAEVVVLGSGPGGYSAAFRAADLGKKVALVERYPSLGGVCLNVGCIPSKALLHLARVVEEADSFSNHGVDFGPPKFDIDKIRGWKESVVQRLTGGIATMAKQRKVRVVQGTGTFTSPHTMRIDGDEGSKTLAFEQAIIAAGSRVARIPGLPYDDPRLMDSTGALELADVPERLLVIGGGIIGLEMATVYHALGSKITVVELLDGLIPDCDRDLVRPLDRWLKARYENIYLETRVTGVEARDDGLEVRFEGEKAPESDVFDRILLAVGRSPNGRAIGAEAAGVHVDDRGFIPVDPQCRTNVPHIFAIGDVAGGPMLAHKATHEGHVAAEVAAGEKSAFDARVIPSVAYTDPEVAWVGLTETEAKAQGIKLGKGVFPWSANGRSLAIGRNEGRTKLLFDDSNHRLLGAGIVGPGAGDLIAELALAIEMGADAQDIALTIHPHPTTSETVGMAAEAFEGTLTDLYLPRRKKK